MTDRITARQCWDILAATPDAVLVDVRTPEEWQHIGVPDLSSIGHDLVMITWNPMMAAAFVAALREAVPDQGAPVYFLCRSGARSQMTADLAEHMGYRHAVNVVEGFEGPPNDLGQRGTVCGWQAEGLPTRTG